MTHSPAEFSPSEFSPAELAEALGLPEPTPEQAAVIAAPPGPLVVIAGAGAGKTETMAARVVWLVANGYADPSGVLGLTFTRKAAGQLLRRVRSRLARLSGHLATQFDGPATVSTYHAFAGTLLREFGPLLPTEPDARLLSDTERWQLAYDVVAHHPGPFATAANPTAVTSMVLALSDELSEHLVDTAQLRDTHRELERLVLTLPPGPRQRPTPNRKLLDLLDTQTQRAALIPLIDALHARMHAERVMDFGAQMSAAARLAQSCPKVGETLRARYRVVLLDEYQDTGHAQRVMLSALFGGGQDNAPALTAVGDPIQSIYGWRGASATNLPRFTTDFACADGSPAPTRELSTSWRNPPRALDLANAVSAEARRRSVEVHPLRARPGAEPGTVICALHRDAAAERDWLADRIAQRWAEGVTAAVLVRRNADAGPVADALTARGIPVEVVGVAGLLSIAEVAQLVSTLRLIADPTAGAAALTVLTGPRWRLGAADLAALWRRAVSLAGHRHAETVEEIIAAAADPDSAALAPVLADALADPGAAEDYSAEGYRRIMACAAELTRLRAALSRPVPDLVADVRRVLGLDVEVIAAGGGTENLDRFADVVARYSERPGADAVGLLAYLDTAADRENGLTPADVGAATGRVQILTVHAAKGLEWQIVAVPHLSARIFPSTAKSRTWLNDPAQLPPLLRGDRAPDAAHGGDHESANGGAHGVPVLDSSDVADRKALEDVIDAHRDRLRRRAVDEERRLLYVALTRTEDTLLISGHHWAAGDSTPRGPSEFLTEIKDVIEATGCGEIECWAPAPADGDLNPMQEQATEAMWPVDPLRSRRVDVQRGADLVRAAMAGTLDGDANGALASGDGDGASAAGDGGIHTDVVADVEALLAERARAGLRPQPALPGQLSVSALVELGRDPSAVHRLTRRLPSRPDPHALLGTAFHEWVQRFYGADRLFDLDDLPGEGDTSSTDARQLEELQAAFAASAWASRTPVDVEVPFEMAIGEVIVRGRIDAVFADPDGTVTVVDWKTGEPPDNDESRRHAAVQLAVYRLAWAALAGIPEDRVSAAFHYVRWGRTVTPTAMPGPLELAELLA